MALGVASVQDILESLPVAGERLRSSRQARERQRDLDCLQRRWAKIWADTAGLTGDRCPRAIDAALVGGTDTEPTVQVTLFELQPGTQFCDVAGASAKIASAINKHKVLIEQYMPSRQDHLSVFGLSHEIDDLGAAAHLDPDLDAVTLEFAAKWAILSAFEKLDMPAPLFLQAEKLTTRGPLLLMTAWKLLDGLAFADVAANTDKLQTMLGCDWCRPYLPDASTYICIPYGVQPSQAVLRKPSDMILRKLEGIDWSYMMRANRIIGSDMRSPDLVGVLDAPQGLKEMQFRYPPAVDANQIVDALSDLKAMSGHGHLEMRMTPEDLGCFSLLVGDNDPRPGP